MLRPKSQIFKVKVMLHKLEAVSNKVASRCHAYLKIDNEEITFKTTPELKKNSAVFNSEAEHDNFSMLLDEITGLYENKTALLCVQIETQGTKVKMGEAVINLGNILNDKKYRIVTALPLSKCYDKTARVKLSVDFIPVTGQLAEQPTTHASQEVNQNRTQQSIEIVREERTRNVPASSSAVAREAASGGNWKQNNYKSRIAQESNYILQEKIYEYEQKMDNYRLTQAQMQQKLHEQISGKDQNISELTMELSRRAQQLADMNLQNQQLRFRLKESIEECSSGKEANKTLSAMVEDLQREEETLRKENQALKTSLESVGRTKEHKEKHLSQELSKYSQKYMESEQQRNRIVFELQAKFKEELDRKEVTNRKALANLQKRSNDASAAYKLKIKQLQGEIQELNESLEGSKTQVRRLKESLAIKERDLTETISSLGLMTEQRDKLQRSLTDQNHELETLQFGYNETERELSKVKDEHATAARVVEQVQMEIRLANQTIDEQRKSLTKYSKELQVHQEREYYLSERFNDELEMKSVNEVNMRGESDYYRQELHRYRHKLKIAEERAEEEGHKAGQVTEALRRVEEEVSGRNRTIHLLGEEKMMAENENRSLRSEVAEMQEAILLLKEENMQLGASLQEKRMAIQNDRSIEWSYKIEQLQRDISEMLQKFKVEKDVLKDSHKRELAKRKEDITVMASQLNRSRDETEAVRKTLNIRETEIREKEKVVEDLRTALRKQESETGITREQSRAWSSEIEELQQKLDRAEIQLQERNKELEQVRAREVKHTKKLESVKNAYTRYLTKPHQLLATFVEMPHQEIEAQMASIVNLSARRFCEEHNRVREQLKRLEQASHAKLTSSTHQEQKVSSYRKVTHIEQDMSLNTKKNYFPQLSFEGKTNTRQESMFELDSLREENGRLKREISEMKVRMKQCEEEVARAERQTDQERFGKEAAKRECDEINDELEKVTLQLKRKEKVMHQYESEMKDLQAELISAKTQYNPVMRASRTQTRPKEREELSSVVLTRRDGPALRDLEMRLGQKNREAENLAMQLNNCKKELENSQDDINKLMTDVRVMEAKYKEKTMKFNDLQQQMAEFNQRQQREQDMVRDKFTKKVHDLTEDVSRLQAENQRLKQKISLNEKQIADLQRKIKTAKDETRGQGMRLKRQNQAALNAQRQTISNLETTIVGLKGELEKERLRQVELQGRTKSMSVTLGAKTAQLQKTSAELLRRSGELADSQQALEELKMISQRRKLEFQEQIGQLQEALQQKDYEVEECRFSTEGRILDLEKRLEQALGRA